MFDAANPDVPVALVHDVLLVEVDGNLLNTLVVYVERWSFATLQNLS